MSQHDSSTEIMFCNTCEQYPSGEKQSISYTLLHAQLNEGDLECDDFDHWASYPRRPLGDEPWHGVEILFDDKFPRNTVLDEHVSLSNASSSSLIVESSESGVQPRTFKDANKNTTVS